jgi:hypothetical protein
MQRINTRFLGHSDHSPTTGVTELLVTAVQWVLGIFSESKLARPHSAPRLRIRAAIPLLPVCACMAYNWTAFIFTEENDKRVWTTGSEVRMPSSWVSRRPPPFKSPITHQCGTVCCDWVATSKIATDCQPVYEANSPFRRQYFSVSAVQETGWVPEQICSSKLPDYTVPNKLYRTLICLSAFSKLET